MMRPSTNDLNGSATSPLMYAAAVPAETVPVATLEQIMERRAISARGDVGGRIWTEPTHTSRSVTAAPSKLIAFPEKFNRYVY